MGVIPVARAHARAADGTTCRLCAETAARAGAGAAVPLRELLTTAAPVFAGIVLAIAGDGSAAWIGGGLAVGITSAAVYIWTRRRGLMRAAHDAHQLGLASLSEDADGRVEAVVKQFEWAVNDLARVRSELTEAQSAMRVMSERAREREHRIDQLVRQITRLRETLAERAMSASAVEPAVRSEDAQPIHLSWGLHLDGPRARVELQTVASGDSPSRLRLMDRDGQIVAVSGVAVVSLDGNLEFQLEPPLDLVADLDAGREIDYLIEGLVGEDWRPVRLTDSGRRTHSVVDIQGRLSRVPELADPVRPPVSHDRRTALN